MMLKINYLALDNDQNWSEYISQTTGYNLSTFKLKTLKLKPNNYVYIIHQCALSFLTTASIKLQ